MRRFFWLVFAGTLLAVSLLGWRGLKSRKPPVELFPRSIFPGMETQRKVKEQKPSAFFSDGRAARPPVAGTVPVEEPVKEEYFSTGVIGDRWGDGIPVPVDRKLLERGRERYTIYCQVCHGAAGYGDGIATQYGLVGPANYHVDRLRQMPDGEIFHTITKGRGLMLGYGANLPIEDRWAIVAYLRVLQKSQFTRWDELSPEEQKLLKEKP
ncbi:c-type cytochrome [Candidatus Methylacidithermus pantelleriae]|uniref:Cytochrome c family protein n=1 Tax=Candidatus Methylacidithermus pantelleriae TaxID=2744239 RepID=A0A8J2BJI9_9BACT|nr:cytochrome c [Candidatus Methylacidithermus pantelleriae]CAF0689619.1 Cytochrome c family protein [Candidatus Methylacidithermus pantelleriae]